MNNLTPALDFFHIENLKDKVFSHSIFLFATFSKGEKLRLLDVIAISLPETLKKKIPDHYEKNEKKVQNFTPN